MGKPKTAKVTVGVSNDGDKLQGENVEKVVDQEPVVEEKVKGRGTKRGKNTAVAKEIETVATETNDVPVVKAKGGRKGAKKDVASAEENEPILEEKQNVAAETNGAATTTTTTTKGKPGRKAAAKKEEAAVESPPESIPEEKAVAETNGTTATTTKGRPGRKAAAKKEEAVEESESIPEEKPAAAETNGTTTKGKPGRKAAAKKEEPMEESEPISEEKPAKEKKRGGKKAKQEEVVPEPVEEKTKSTRTSKRNKK